MKGPARITVTARPANRLRLAIAASGLLLAAAGGSVRADALLEYESPVFTKLVIDNDNPESAGRRRALDRAPGRVRVRIRLSDTALATAGESGNTNSLPAGQEGIRNIEIVADDLAFDYTNPQHRVEFSVKTDKGQVVEWQLQGSAQGGRQTVTVLGPGRTLTGRGNTIEGAGNCPALDIVQVPGVLTWYCGIGTWKASRIAPEIRLAPLSAR